MLRDGPPGHMAEGRNHPGEHCHGPPGGNLEEIQAAARAAHAHGFIRRLPEGYDTVIGEAGGSLSQGQKQLLCIARVMLCLPPMLILDEATSSIDTRTEQKIQQAFAALMEGRTSFIVAHRLSTIQEADLILVMRDGAIVEQGTHASLFGPGWVLCGAVRKSVRPLEPAWKKLPDKSGGSRSHLRGCRRQQRGCLQNCRKITKGVIFFRIFRNYIP